MELPENLLKRLQTCRTLPSVPAVVVQVLDLANDMSAIDAGDLARVVARDPAMVTRILKVANSVRSGVRHEVAVLEQAISLLGLTEAMSLALSFSLVGTLKSKRGMNFDHQQYWLRSILSATAATEIGSMLKTAQRGELFLAGLVNDIGMLVLNEALPEYGRLVASSMNDHFRLVEIEHRELQTDHAAVGAWLLNRWGLPKHLVYAVRDSHKDKNESMLANSVILGSRIAEIWINTESLEALENAASVADALFLLESEQMNYLLTQIAGAFPEIVADLGVTISSEFEVEKLLEQSRSALAEINVKMIHEARRLAAQAQRDSLTMLYNRTYLEQNFDNQFMISANTGQPLTVIFIDVDCFKQINDTYGHTGGDIVLIEIARAILTAIRKYDIAVRYGGDEFVALLANAPQEVALDISERIRAMVASQMYTIDENTKINATVSVGYATLMPGSSIKTSAELLEAADKKLYAAKSAGRNRVA